MIINPWCLYIQAPFFHPKICLVTDTYIFFFPVACPDFKIQKFCKRKGPFDDVLNRID